MNFLSLFLNIFQRVSNLEKGLTKVTKEMDDLNASNAEMKASVASATAKLVDLAAQIKALTAAGAGSIDPAAVEAVAVDMHNTATALNAAVNPAP